MSNEASSTGKRESLPTSYSERSVWIQILGLIVSLLIYGGLAAKLMGAGVRELAPFLPVFLIAAVVMIVVMVGSYIVSTFWGADTATDERERVIHWRAEARSAWLLTVGVLGGIAALFMGLAPLWIVHILLGSLYASELVRLVLELIAYRRGY